MLDQSYRTFVKNLEQQGELIRFTKEVDPLANMAAVGIDPKESGLEIYCGVDDKGNLADKNHGNVLGEASKTILGQLEYIGALWKREKITHSYPHCWRHKTPIIYRATSQWFASMDKKVAGMDKSLREIALAGIEETQFYPAWGKQRLHGMIANRPDWTLSRQRQWGVPMAYFVSSNYFDFQELAIQILLKFYTFY